MASFIPGLERLTSRRELSASRKRLARIRCVRKCTECFKDSKPLPEPLCYVAAEREYKVSKRTKVSLYEDVYTSGRRVSELVVNPEDKISVSDEEFWNEQGQWTKFIKLAHGKTTMEPVFASTECHILMYNNDASCDETQIFTPVPQQNPLISSMACYRWEDVVEHHYSVENNSNNKALIAPPDLAAMTRFQSCPPNWSIEHDQDLAHFLESYTSCDNEKVDSAKNYVDSISVSSYLSDSDGVENLTDGELGSYWESDGSKGQHWIRLSVKKGIIIKKLILVVDGCDDSYMPSRIQVWGGPPDNLVKMREVVVDKFLYSTNDVVVLDDQSEFISTIEIRIKECQDDGLDCRVHGLKIKPSKAIDMGLNSALFSDKNLIRFPRLENISTSFLYRRALLLQRFVSLLDSVLPFIAPAWQYSTGSYASLEAVRQFLPLSAKRISLIATFLRQSETRTPTQMPKLYINRAAAMEHRTNPTLDPSCKNTIFNQMYEGLKPRDRSSKPLNYRWPGSYEQWWECNFLSEGIIDQGGGFRDSLSDLAEELCPSETDATIPLPYFIRTPNETSVDSNANRDMFIPNPSCQLYSQYEWIGQLMGACLRSKESLVLSLPSFIWKKLSGESVSWKRDFITVDEAEVRILANMGDMDEESFEAYFSEERMWTTTLSDSSLVPLFPGGEHKRVGYSERLEYASLVPQIRMEESSKQVAALRRGLLQVVPQAVLDLLTWQELECRVCGEVDISIKDLRRTTQYEEVEKDDPRVRHLWQALENFSNKDRSRFLRFVTGRRRLPAPIYICPDKGESVDALPESSTCAQTLYLPNYSSAKIAEEKIRYAAYNCIAIDTDLSPWDE